jgi:hypothetical protein
MGRLESEQKFEHEQVCHARQKGILGTDEPVSGTLSLYMHRVPLLWPSRLLFTISFSLFRKRFLLAITDHRVLLVKVDVAGSRGRQESSAYSTLPCALRLLKAPKPIRHVLDNKLALPSDLAAFAGRPFLYTSDELKAESIIKIASSNGR